MLQTFYLDLLDSKAVVKSSQDFFPSRRIHCQVFCILCQKVGKYVISTTFECEIRISFTIEKDQQKILKTDWVKVLFVYSFSTFLWIMPRIFYIKSSTGGTNKNVFVDERKKAIRSFWLISDYLTDGVSRRVTVARDVLTNDDQDVWTLDCQAVCALYNKYPIQYLYHLISCISLSGRHNIKVNNMSRANIHIQNILSFNAILRR